MGAASSHIHILMLSRTRILASMESELRIDLYFQPSKGIHHQVEQLIRCCRLLCHFIEGSAQLVKTSRKR
jgi:hypothetical protein